VSAVQLLRTPTKRTRRFRTIGEVGSVEGTDRIADIKGGEHTLSKQSSSYQSFRNGGGNMPSCFRPPALGFAFIIKYGYGARDKRVLDRLIERAI
jgi:hypothetical protein